MWKEAVIDEFKVVSRHSQIGTEKITENFCEDMCFNRYSNQAPPKYKSVDTARTKFSMAIQSLILFSPRVFSQSL
jgi:hypothetical protein